MGHFVDKIGNSKTLRKKWNEAGGTKHVSSCLVSPGHRFIITNGEFKLQLHIYLRELPIDISFMHRKQKPILFLIHLLLLTLDHRSEL